MSFNPPPPLKKRKLFYLGMIIGSQEVAEKCVGRSHVIFTFSVSIWHKRKAISKPGHEHWYNLQNLFRFHELCVFSAVCVGGVSVQLCAILPP